MDDPIATVESHEQWKVQNDVSLGAACNVCGETEGLQVCVLWKGALLWIDLSEAGLACAQGLVSALDVSAELARRSLTSSTLSTQVQEEPQVV